jgi:cobalamin biosynthesis protein CbiD
MEPNLYMHCSRLDRLEFNPTDDILGYHILGSRGGEPGMSDDEYQEALELAIDYAQGNRMV